MGSSREDLADDVILRAYSARMVANDVQERLRDANPDETRLLAARLAANMALLSHAVEDSALLWKRWNSDAPGPDPPRRTRGLGRFLAALRSAWRAFRHELYL